MKIVILAATLSLANSQTWYESHPVHEGTHSAAPGGVRDAAAGAPTSYPTPPPTQVQGHWAFSSSNAAHVEVTQDGQCFTDGHGDYKNHETATITVLKDGVIDSREFNVEGYYDRLVVPRSGHSYYSGSSGPRNVAVRKGDQITWRSDYSILRSGFTICMTGPYVPPQPRKKGDLFYTNAVGVVDVTKDGRCFTDGAGEYNNGERAQITVLKDMVIHSEEMHTEAAYDWLTINGDRHDGDELIRNIHVTAGSNIMWRSDGSIRRHGFTICTGQRAAALNDHFDSSDDKIIHLSADGKCFTDGRGPYQNGESASVKVLVDGALHSTEMNTESEWDWLTINGKRYDGDASFKNIPVKKGDKITWFSDGSGKRDGFTVCLTPAVMVNRCDTSLCGEWACAEWCTCFDETVEATGAYAAAGCIDDSTDTCRC